MKPTRSANSTETRRRSAIGASMGREPAGVRAGASDADTSPEAAAAAAATPIAAAAAAEDVRLPLSGEPHSPQNPASGSLAAPQTTQAVARGDPQRRQNLRSGRSSAWQVPQITWSRSRGRSRAAGLLVVGPECHGHGFVAAEAAERPPVDP